MALSLSFIDYSTSFWMEAVSAEIYMRIYQYAAEDFRSVSDCRNGHTLVQSWMNSTNSNISAYTQLVQTHTHVVPFGTSSPPVAPMIYTVLPGTIIPISTTGRIENIAGNSVVPSEVLSYIDLSLDGVNIPFPSFRRGMLIPIAYGPVSMAIKS